MKHNIKLVLALALAAMMIVSSFAAIADIANSGSLIMPEGTTPDATISISGLAAGDQVTLYQIISYVSKNNGKSAGWALVEPFASDAYCVDVFEAINRTATNVYSLTQADVEKFTDVINDDTNPEPTAITGGTITNGTYTYTLTDVNQAGMYIALVAASEVATLYNPIIISADFSSTNGTNTIDASTAYVGANTAMMKKTSITLTKEQEDPDDKAPTDSFDDYGYKPGDTVNFTVTTTIPLYQEIYSWAKFNVFDTLSDGLTFNTNSLKVYAGDAAEANLLTADNQYTVLSTPRTGADWEINFASSYILGLSAAQPITITYSATVNNLTYKQVNEESNSVEVEFSNNPNDENDVGKLKDETRQYTFTIDGELLGESGIFTSELIKVAVDGNGDVITQSRATGATFTNALEGAVFALYTNSACTQNDVYVNSTVEIDGEAYDYGNIVTDRDGHILIPGLEDGTYYLKEKTAPTGYIKDQGVHTIVISATTKTVTVAEANGYPEYSYEDLDTWTVTIDGTATSTYTNTLTGPIEYSEIEISTSKLNNTKGIELPSTGGIGTTIFYVGGSLMVLAAAILLITKRRMGVED